MRQRQCYVLMFIENGKAMFATFTIKRVALKHAKRIKATVYPVPYPGTGWDCPTIRATFAPIYVPKGN